MILLVTLVFFAVTQVLWIAVTPLRFQSVGDSLPGGNTAPILVGTGPDEPEHYLYILSLANQHRLPVPTDALRRSPSEFVSHEGQHPPLFYIIAAAILKIVKPLGGDRVVWYALRTFCAICGALAVWLLARAGLAAFPNRPLVALATAPFVALLPMFGYMTGTLSNLPLEMVLTAFAWLLLAELARGKRSLNLRSGALLGLALGLAVITRVTSLLWLPPTLVVLVFVYRRIAVTADARRAALTGIAAMCLITACLTLPWFIHMKLAYGSFFFRSDYRPMLGNISVGKYLSNTSQWITIPNFGEPIRIPLRSVMLWYASAWLPFWLAQYGLPGVEKNAALAGVAQSLFIVIDFLALTLLLLHAMRGRRGAGIQLEPDPAGRALLWAAGIATTLAVLAVLQQQLFVDVIIVIYAGRYTTSVVAASGMLFLFALSTRGNGWTLKSCTIRAGALTAVMFLFDLCAIWLVHRFYALQVAGSL